MTDAACREFLERLDDFVEGRLSPADRDAAERHLAACGACRDLQSLFAEAAAPVPPPADLLGAVLQKTIGSACGAARARLCDRIDRLLDAADDELVRMHLDGCVECGRLSAALARLALDLPSLAVIEPDPRFVPDVLARTAGRAPGLARLTERLSSGWRRLAHRPRLAWEGAFIVWIAVVILFGTPSAPFAGVPGRALRLVRAAQGSVPPGLIEQEAPKVRLAVRTRWSETTGRLQLAGRSAASDLERRSSAVWAGVKQKIGTVVERIASGKGMDKDKGESR